MNRNKFKNFKEREIYPDEVFLDSKNMPGFDRERFEGRIEKPIPRSNPYVVFAVFAAVTLGFSLWLAKMQIVDGSDYRFRANNNRLKAVVLPANRGTIYDRNGVALAFNGKDGERRYTEISGLGHIIGYVGFPDEVEFAQGTAGNNKTGKYGIEKVYEEILRGLHGKRLVEETADREIVSQSVAENPVQGRGVVLSIDAELQSNLFRYIKNVSEERGFNAGSAIAMNLKTGELLALTSFPEIDPNLLVEGDSEKIDGQINSANEPFFFRAVQGVYSPGSVFKPIVAIASLAENTVDPEKEIFSSGSISVPNPYFPDKKSIFKDWKVHGWVDMTKAIAVSSNVYFYAIGGGYEDQEGVGVSKIAEYSKMFGLGKKVGVIFNEAEGFVPTSEWKTKAHSEDPLWRVGDTYNLSIGQGFLQVTPIQMAKVLSLIAGEGSYLPFTIIDKLIDENGTFVSSPNKPKKESLVEVDPEVFKTVKEGMRLAVLEGTASALSGTGTSVAGKTGTAEVFRGTKTNSWFMGFAPYEDPEFGLVVVLEEGSPDNLVGAASVSRSIMQWVVNNRPEYVE